MANEGEVRVKWAVPAWSPENVVGRPSKGEGEENCDHGRKRRAVIMTTNSQEFKNVLDERRKKSRSSPPPPGSEEEILAAVCPVCDKMFCSKKAMYGHMRCHPEREWRGVNPPPPPPPPNMNNIPNYAISANSTSSSSFSPPSPYNSSSTIASTAGTCTHVALQPPLGWLMTGRRGQNHPLSFALMQHNNPSVDHGRAASLQETASQRQDEEDEKNNVELEVDGRHDGRNKMDDEEELIVTCREYKCSTCDKVFGTFQALGGHRSSHSYRNKFEGLGSVMDKGSEEEEEAAAAADKFKCNICGKTFPSGQALGGHKRTHFQPATPNNLHQEYCSSVQVASNNKSLGGKVLDFDINEIPPMEEG